MDEPYSDAYMRYDELKHRYILTPKCVLDELGIDMEARLSAKGSANPQATINALLDRVSALTYRFIYAHNIDNEVQRYAIETLPSARRILFEAMKAHLTYVMAVGDLSLSSDKNKRLQYMDDVAAEMLANPLPELGHSLIYTGGWRYC